MGNVYIAPFGSEHIGRNSDGVPVVVTPGGGVGPMEHVGHTDDAVVISEQVEPNIRLSFEVSKHPLDPDLLDFLYGTD